MARFCVNAGVPSQQVVITSTCTLIAMVNQTLQLMTIALAIVLLHSALEFISTILYDVHIDSFGHLRDSRIRRGVQKEMFEPTRPLTTSWKGIL